MNVTQPLAGRTSAGNAFPQWLQNLLAYLPAGNPLPPDVWLGRHRAILWLVWAQAVALFAFALVAFPLGARSDDPYQMYLADVFTIPANMAGIPGVAIPCGFSDGLPVSLQILGPPFAEATILRIADAYERSESWVDRRPDVTLAR